MHRLALPTILIFLLAMALASPARAHTIVVVRPDASDRMLTESFSRMCGELRMYGINVNLVESDDGAPPSDERFAELGQSADVVGGVAFVRTAGQAGAKIWITDAATGRGDVRITVSINDADAPNLLAIRAVDLLRASLRDVDRSENARPQTPPVPATGVSSPTPTVPAGEVPGFDAWAIRAGGGALGETGTLGMGYAAGIGLQRRLFPRLALELTIIAPVVGQDYAGVARARLREELGILGVAWRLMGRQRLSADIIQGFGVMHLSVSGEAQSPWVGLSSSAWAAALLTGGRIGLRLSQHFGLEVSLAAVFLLPRPQLEVGNTSYLVHQPLILAAGGLCYGF